MKKNNFSWLDIEEACGWIVTELHEANIKVDAVVGIPRGGVIPAIIISHLLEIPYVADISDTLYGQSILVVDDICDTGSTFKKFVEKYSDIKMTTASIVSQKESAYTPRFSPIIEEGNWVVFPWETEESSKVDGTEV